MKKVVYRTEKLVYIITTSRNGAYENFIAAFLCKKIGTSKPPALICRIMAS